MISSVKDFKIAEKTAASEKFISAADFDSSIFTALFNTSDRLTLEIADVQKKLKAAKESKNDTKALKEKIAILQKERNINDSKIKDAKKKNVLYNRAHKPTLDARKCIARYESYLNYLTVN
jgi:hypothetical protein